MRTINRVMIHCSDSPPGRGDDVETIRKWHTDKKPDGNGWRDIGYHWVILENGTKQAGRPEEEQGAHVKRHNRDSLGICLIGIDSFTEEQFTSLGRLLRQMRGRYPGIAIYGHSDFDEGRSCPNFDVAEWCQQRGL